MRFIGFLLTLLVVGTVGVLAYNAGLANGAAEAALAEGAAVVYAPGGGFSPFGLIIGLFILFLVLGFIGKAFAWPRRALGPRPWGHGYWGYGRWAQHHDWSHEDVPEAFRPMLERWHESAHGNPPPSSAPPGGPGVPPGSGVPPGPGAPTGPGPTGRPVNPAASGGTAQPGRGTAPPR